MKDQRWREGRETGDGRRKAGKRGGPGAGLHSAMTWKGRLLTAPSAARTLEKREMAGASGCKDVPVLLPV